MHSFLVIGNPNIRLNYLQNKLREWQISQFDHLSLTSNETSLGVAEIRRLINKLNLKPVNSRYVVVSIDDATALTIEAQNALLKTLEEPPAQVRLILLAQNGESLLPTVCSRCQIINLSHLVNLTNETPKPTFSQLISLTLGQRLVLLAQAATSREAAVNWIDLTIRSLEKKFHEADSTIELNFVALIMRQLLQARQQLTANVSPRLVLGNLAVFY